MADRTRQSPAGCAALQRHAERRRYPQSQARRAMFCSVRRFGEVEVASWGQEWYRQTGW